MFWLQIAVVDVTISVGSGEGRDDKISQSQTLLGPRRAEEHGMLVVYAAKISDCSSKRRLWAKFQVTNLRVVQANVHEIMN